MLRLEDPHNSVHDQAYRMVRQIRDHIRGGLSQPDLNRDYHHPTLLKSIFIENGNHQGWQGINYSRNESFVPGPTQNS